jgi:hypothetical protein
MSWVSSLSKSVSTQQRRPLTRDQAGVAASPTAIGLQVCPYAIGNLVQSRRFIADLLFDADDAVGEDADALHLEFDNVAGLQETFQFQSASAPLPLAGPRLPASR